MRPSDWEKVSGSPSKEDDRIIYQPTDLRDESDVAEMVSTDPS